MFIAKNNDLIILASQTREELEQQLQFIVYTDIEETDFEYQLYNGEYLTVEEILEKERERKNKLFLTRADVERAIYNSKGITFDDILELVKKLPDIDVKVLKIELSANHFYRGNIYVSKIGRMLGLSETDLDYLFENGKFKG